MVDPQGRLLVRTDQPDAPPVDLSDRPLVRKVLADFGVALPDEAKVRVWDSTAETRFIVLPMRPTATEGWSEEKLASLVTRDSMIGTGFPKPANEVAA